MATVTVGSRLPSPAPATLNRSILVGPGCLALFLLPFAAIGAFTGWRAVQAAVEGNWREAAFFALFAFVFGGVGFGGLTGTVYGYGKLKKEAALQQSHPGQPWLWRDDWASGRIDDTTRATLWGAWLFAILWNSISFPSAYLGVRSALQDGNRAGLIGLLFPVAGTGLLVWAVRSTLRYRKYGISRLELSKVPGVIGRVLSGTVRAPGSVKPADGFQVTLSCIQQVTTRSGKNSSTTENILWQEESRVAGVPSRTAATMETHIAVAFRLPSDARVCEASDPNNRILWRLQLSASVPGVDYQSVFEVPVFRTAESDQPLSETEARLTEDPSRLATYQQPADSRIAVTSNRRGTEILFPAARNPGAASSLTFFTVLWFAFIALQLHLKAPLLFPIVTGLFGLLLLIGVLDLWLQVSRVNVDAGILTLATGYLHPGRERTVPVSEIADVTVPIGMRAGTTLYYDIAVIQKGGKKMTAGHSIRDKREAEWLAVTIKRALGLATSKPGAALGTV